MSKSESVTKMDIVARSLNCQSYVLSLDHSCELMDHLFLKYNFYFSAHMHRKGN